MPPLWGLEKDETVFLYTYRPSGTMVNLRINWTLYTGEVRKPRLPSEGHKSIYFSGLP